VMGEAWGLEDSLLLIAALDLISLGLWSYRSHHAAIDMVCGSHRRDRLTLVAQHVDSKACDSENLSSMREQHNTLRRDES
jgi:hypothetical protein